MRMEGIFIVLVACYFCPRLFSSGVPVAIGCGVIFLITGVFSLLHLVRSFLIFMRHRRDCHGTGIRW